MSKTYAAHGLRFQYPEGWELSEQQQENELLITVSSPDTSFWTLTLLYDRPEPDEIIESALEVFQDEYEDLDIYDSEAKLCRRETLAKDLEFICFELVNSAFLRAVQLPNFSLLVLYQGTDHELEDTLESLEAISTSLKIQGKTAADD